MVILLVIVVFGQMCIAGTWIDDFSDRNLRDWGFRGLGGGTVINDEVSLGVVGGHFYYRGKNQRARYDMKNWALGKIQDFSLELKLWLETSEFHGRALGLFNMTQLTKKRGIATGWCTFCGIPNPKRNPTLYLLRLIVSSRGVLEDHPEFEDIWIAQTAGIDSFAYEEKVWYTLRIAREGNQYTFSIGDVILFAEDDSVPMGTIELFFHGRCTIWLDDFTVTGPDVPNGGPGFLGVNPLAEGVTTMWGKLKAQNWLKPFTPFPRGS